VVIDKANFFFSWTRINLMIFIRACAMMLNGDVESKVQHLDAMQWCVELDESGERS